MYSFLIKEIDKGYKKTTIIDNYDTTIYVEEALHRLVEIYYFIGLEKEAKKYAKILGYNYNSCLLYTSPSPRDS